MGVSQIKSSFQNDGNFSQLDLQDVETGGPILRIETFRCSQPRGTFGTTASGTDVQTLAGKDHLVPTSNRTFRHVFSAGPKDNVKALLEIREIYDEAGSFAVVVRDIDGESSSFGYTLAATVNATAAVIKGNITVSYSIVSPPAHFSPKIITSPVQAPITQQIPYSVDLSDIPVPSATTGDITITFDPNDTNATALSTLGKFADDVQRTHPQWASNVQLYERMGDFRDKCIHSGVNLVGSRQALASEYLLVRAYRKSLIVSGAVFDPAMRPSGSHIVVDDPLSLDTKPGVYIAFLSAYALNIGLYQLGLDKVHSDYGGIPMELQPGSRLEEGARSVPVVDATNLNKVLAALAAFLYAPDALVGLKNAKHGIEEFRR